MPTSPSDIKGTFLGINRHRLGIDGHGVVTLVAFMGCPLRCEYCLNDMCHDTTKNWRQLTVQQLIDELMVDNLYFLATDGGVTFGGGEPLLHSRFIEEFGKTCDPHWNITLETSLNVPLEHLERVYPYVKCYFIDIKDMNRDIYERYTCLSQDNLLTNLEWLMSQPGAVDKVTVRLPHIPDYNTQADVDHSRKVLEEMGVKNFDEFDYVIRNKEEKKNGKRKESVQ